MNKTDFEYCENILRKELDKYTKKELIDKLLEEKVNIENIKTLNKLYRTINKLLNQIKEKDDIIFWKTQEINLLKDKVDDLENY